MGCIYLLMFPAFIFIGLYISIEAKQTDVEEPLQVSNKKLEIREEQFHPNNDYFDLFNFNPRKPNPRDRKYEQQELDIGSRSENITYEGVLGHDNESSGNLENVSDNNQGNVFGHFANASNKGSEVNNDINHKSSLIQNESDKGDRKEKKHFKHSNLRKIRLGVKIKNNNSENLNKHYGNSDDNNKNYVSDDRYPSRKYKGSNNLRQISNNFKFMNYKFRNHEKYIENVKDSISEDSEESLNGISFQELWICAEDKTEENKSECITDSEKNISESEPYLDESEVPNSSGQGEDKHSNSKVSHQHNDKSGHLKHKADILHLKINGNDNLNAVYPDKSFERQNTSIEGDGYLIKHENRGESNHYDQLNKNKIPLSVENVKQTNSRRNNYKLEKNKVLGYNEKHLGTDINGSSGFVVDNLMKKVLSRKHFGRQNEMNIRNLNKKAIGYPEDEYLSAKNSELINRNKRIKSKFSTPSAEESSTTEPLFYVKVSCENCKIRSKIILHNSMDTNKKKKP